MALDPVIREQVHQYFVLEAPELLSALEQELLDLQQGFSLPKVNNLMRTAHTLKGAAASIGLETIRAIAKSLEDIFRSLCHADQTISPTVEALLFEGVECLRLALNAECAGEPINDGEILERTTAIVAQVQAEMGHSFNPDTALPSAAELGYDLTKSMFETGVSNQLDKIAAALDQGDPTEIARVLRTQSRVFLGLAEAEGLPGFGATARAALDALDNQPDQAVTIAQVALEDFRAGQAQVLAGDRTVGGDPSEMLRQLAGVKFHSLEDQDTHEANLGSDPGQLLNLDPERSQRNSVTPGVLDFVKALFQREAPKNRAEALSTSTTHEAEEVTNASMEDIWGKAIPPVSFSSEQPIQIAAPPALSPNQASSKLKSTQRILEPTQKILIVDDSLTVRRTLALVFEGAGYSVVQAEDGYEAIEQFEQHSDIQLIICDIEMPRMDGLEFLSFRQHDPSLAKIPVVILTSLEDDTHRSLALQLGATTYIIKHAYLKEKVLATARVLLQKNKIISEKNRISPGWIKWLVPALILMAGWLTYFFWKNHLTLPFQQTAGVEVPRDPDLQPRNSMQEVENIPSGLFNYGGSPAFAALASHGMNDAIIAAHPDYRLRYTEPPSANPGSGTGIDMLINGELSIAQSSRPLEDADYNKAKTRGLSLKQVPVAIDGVVYYSHPGLSIPGLSVDQLQGIYRGEVTNWQQVGGPNLKITPIGLDPKITSALKLLLGNDDGIGSNVEIVRDYTAAIRKVAETPGGISYASAPIVINQKAIRPIAMAKAKSNQYIQPFTADQQVNETAFKEGTYPMTRRLFIVIRRDGSIDEKAGTAYINLLLSREGQDLIEKAGYVAIQ